MSIDRKIAHEVAKQVRSQPADTKRTERRTRIFEVLLKIHGDTQDCAEVARMAVGVDHILTTSEVESNCGQHFAAGFWMGEACAHEPMVYKEGDPAGEPPDQIIDTCSFCCSSIQFHEARKEWRRT